MTRSAGFAAVLLVSLSARAGLPEVKASAAQRKSLDLTLVETPLRDTCVAAVEPSQWRDPSDARFMVTSPTALHDDQELASGVITALADLRFVRGALHLFVLGSPLRSGLTFSTAGWHARWPFC